MPFNKFWIIAGLALCLTACGDEEATPDEQVSTPSPAPAAAPAASSGGYEPNESERVPGITMSQEELDKLDAEARANTPAPVIPAQ